MLGNFLIVMIHPNSFHAWFLAARPKTLTGAIAPVLVGAAFAIRTFITSGALSTSVISQLSPFLLCILFAVFMQIDANFINDYFDFKKGTDREDRLGPERACAQGWITPRAMQWGIAVMTLLSCLVGMVILLLHLQWELLLVGLFCVIFCFLYTTHLSYLGWGDLLVLIFFGFIPVVFTHYVMTDGAWCIPLLIASFAMGLATDNLLMVNNYRDRHQDLLSGKRTIIVRILEAQIKRLGKAEGQKRGEGICRIIYLSLGIIATFLGIIARVLLPSHPMLASLPHTQSVITHLLLIYLVLHAHTYRQLCTFDGRDLNQVLGMTARNIFLFGFLLAISILF